MPPRSQGNLIDPLRELFLSLLPVRHVVHPLGCHRPRIDDVVVFDKLVEALVFGCGYERLADASCSATTMRRRRDEWIRLGIWQRLRLICLDAYDKMGGPGAVHIGCRRLHHQGPRVAVSAPAAARSTAVR